MALQPGTRLESYEILATLGSGGMGEVYRARDTKLHRDVALKILPVAFSTDPERVSRLMREAQMLAAVKHANIAQIYGIVDAPPTATGAPVAQALVMELVEGEDLALRLQRGPIPVEEALQIAIQIADALDAAHERGIVHRDLKPGNITVAADGVVKVIDFGLAKRSDPLHASSPDASVLPTVFDQTMTGVIMGTPAYMSPEQARGQSVDRAADVWAMACVLYEMLSGVRAFRGGTTTDILAAIVSSEPDWHALPSSVPPSVQRLLRSCLVKDRRHRLRDAGTVWLALKAAVEGRDPEGEGRADAPRSSRATWMVAGVAAALGLAAGIALVYALRSSPAAVETHTEITTPPTEDEISIALSPDGRFLAFVATSDGLRQLWLRSLDGPTARVLPGTDGASYPFWSHDGRSLAFFASNKLKRIDLAGGPVRDLANSPPGRGGTWSANGVILFAPLDGPILRVEETGGMPTPVTRVLTPQQSNHRFPHFLPDGRHFLFYVRGAPDVRGVYVGSLDDAPMRRLFDADVGVTTYSVEHLFFVRRGILLAQPFDLTRLETSGDAVPVAEQIFVDTTGLGLPVSVSAGGSIAYRTAVTSGRRQLIWFDRAGREISRIGEPDEATPTNPERSADGRRLVTTRTVNGEQSLWILEGNQGLLNAFTIGGEVDDFAVWSPDGSHVVFASNRKGAFDLFRKSIRDGAEDLLLTTPSYKSPSDWSPDGRFVLFRTTDPETGYDLWALPMEAAHATGERKPVAVVRSGAEERDGQFSPDGRWIAYQSNESGRFEIYVQAFPGPGGKARVSTAGGAQVRWRRDGAELFYVSLNGQLMAVPIRLDAKAQTVDAGKPVVLFHPPLAGGVLRGVNRQQYIVGEDGQRFLMNALVDDVPASPIRLIMNWRPPAR